MPDRPFARALPIAIALLGAVPAVAQYPDGAVVQRLPQPSDPGEQLAAALRTLSISPNDLSALIAAGTNALALGDPNAAAGFFGRADTIAPRDGRVKAGLGSTLVQLGKPQDALRMFGQASALGIPDAAIAEDRGLAYDLGGDTTHAQADYRRVLAAQPDDDAARRRLALSQGIAGDRKGAIATLDPLIRKRDIAAWRAQTFVLAMTGDPQGANDITRIMLPQQQAALQPFLVRLASLTPAQKARAVHFGEMPAQRGYPQSQLASTGPAPTYAAAPQPAYQPPAYRAPVRPAYSPPAQPVRAAAAPTPAPRPASDLAPVAAPPAAVRVAAVTPSVAGPSVAYRDAPLAQTALATTSLAPSQSAPATTAVPLSQAPPATTGVIAAVAPATTSVAPPAAAPALTVPQVAANAPPSVATALPMPMGADGSSGHFDVPSASIVRRAPPHAAQSVVRTTPPAAIAQAAVPIPAAATVASVATMPLPVERPAPVGVAASESVRLVPHPATPRTTAGLQDTVPRPVSHRTAATRSAPADDEAAATIEPTAKPARAARADTAASSRRGTRVALDANEDASTPRPRKGAAKLADATDDTPRRGRSSRERENEAAALDRSETDAPTPHARKGTAKLADETDDTPRRGKSARTRDDDATDTTTTRKGRRGAAARAAEAADDKPARKGARAARGDDEDTGPSRGKERAGAKADDARGAASRVFVQVAGGANKADMDKAWGSVKKQAPDLMKGRAPSTTPLRATNRLLVGPFKDEDEAQVFVNKMAGKGMSGFVFKSAKGQKVDKIDAAK